MHFPARELKPYAEPVKNCDLEEGEVYFFLTFFDDRMLVPRLEPVVFVGRDLHPGDSGLVYFQDYESHVAGVRLKSGESKELSVGGHFFQGPENETGHVFDYARALEVLMNVSLKRERDA